MSNWHLVAPLSALPVGGMLPFAHGGKQLLVYRTPSGLFATSRRCTHQAADLLRGYLDRDVIECPLHQGRFSISSGAALSAPACDPLATYEVKVVDEAIMVKLA
jgi:3-phenylpropionate/trans-cinnamate dioxygenase ferredoxin component